ncbi:MAG: NAD(P)H-binding protein [Limibacillus sp.]|jgi:divinyl chlorophyllide a 8-vinyl-reductase
MTATSPASKQASHDRKKRVFLLGATGTIGRATAWALAARGHELVCFVRPQAAGGTGPSADLDLPKGAEVRRGDVTSLESLTADGFKGEPFDCLVSCLASRSGAPRDAWAIDHAAHLKALAVAQDCGVASMVLLSAICVQRPRVQFQFAKLAFERALMESGLTYSIVRPTAFFKSLSGQIERVKQGKSFLLFGDGRLTACKPISAGDLAEYLSDCLEKPELQNKILPIGGPGKAITPLEQGEELFRLLGRTPKYSHVPLGLLDSIIWTLAALGKLSPPLAAKAELARIGRYYASESMLVFDEEMGRYDPDLTPSTGSETLFDYYEQVIRGAAKNERVDQAVF